MGLGEGSASFLPVSKLSWKGSLIFRERED
jgi:hypothetical protein